MSNELQMFKYTEAYQIRTTVIDGEAWFVAKDIANALGYQRTADAIAAHVDEEDKLTRQFTDSGQRRDMTVINESGMYSLIFASKLSSAKQFKRWVTSEVLPSIRKSGMYLSNQAAEAYLHNPEQFAEMAARCSALRFCSAFFASFTANDSSKSCVCKGCSTF